VNPIVLIAAGLSVAPRGLLEALGEMPPKEKVSKPLTDDDLMRLHDATAKRLRRAEKLRKLEARCTTT
jgi:hypothetical protein